MTGATNDSRQSGATFKVLPKAVSELAQHHPDNTWVTIPNDADLKTGWRDITYRELSTGVNGMARWIERNVGIGKRNVDVAAYIGLNDMRYTVVEVALVKTGYRGLLPSPRNSQEGQSSLFETTNCRILLHSEGVVVHVEPIKAALPGLKVVQIPDLEELLRLGSENGTPIPDVPCDKEDDQVLILHTSGSTGLPKPIYHTNGSISTVAATNDIQAPQGRRNAQSALFEPDRPLLVAAPFFHMMGQAVSWRTILNRSPIIRLPAQRPVTADLILEVLEQTKPWAAIFPPSLLEEITEAPGGLDALSKLVYIFFGGGPLADAIGDKLTQTTNLVSVIGSTEAGLIPTRIPADKHDWKYFEWAPGSGADMEPEAGSGGLYEMVIKPADRRYQGVFHTFPDIKEWRTQDLFSQHPNKKGLWLYKGRKDDVLVLSNGEKFNPVGFEKALESHPLVKGALVVGQGRFQTGLLVEPDWSQVPESMDPSSLLDKIWSAIEASNEASPAHGRVWRSKVAIAKQDKPFKRTPKGSIVRRQTTSLYRPEIDALYSNEASDEEVGKLTVGSDSNATKKSLRKIFKIKGIEIPESASDDQDIFSFGVDSLQVLALASTLSHACSDDTRKVTISPRDVYGNPTINSLARFLQIGDDAQSGANQSREEIMANVVEKYTNDLLRVRAAAPKEKPEKHTYLLTGSTGSLGGYILRDLIASPDVGHIYCLNRSADAEDRQRQIFQNMKAEPDFHKVTFLQSDFGKDFFGLNQNVYESLLRSVTQIIHNAWAVDFNKTLQTYEQTHIAGTRRCVDFSLQSKYRAQITFISSIASVGGYPVVHPEANHAPEESFEDHRVPLPQGYGESKHVASLILAHAAKDVGVPATIIRAGQLAGPSGEGAQWNRHEWLPSIVISSKALGLVPERLGNQDTVDWVPMDKAAASVIDISKSRSQSREPLAVAHLVNPQTVSWSALVPFVRESLELETGKEVKIVSFREWLDKLAESPRTLEEIEKKPGIKLIDFYEGLLSEGGGLPSLATEKTQKLSNTVATMKSVDAALMKKWLKQWEA